MGAAEDQTTCGKGLAEHAELPAKLAAVLAAVAEVLEEHTRALLVADEDARREFDVYTVLSNDHRRVAAELAGLAERMASQRELPMGAHDAKALQAAAPLRAFQRFVEAEGELAALLERRLEGDRTMLDEMAQAVAAPPAPSAR